MDPSHSDRYRFIERQTSFPGYILAALLGFVLIKSLFPFLLTKSRLFWQIHHLAPDWLSPTFLSNLIWVLIALLLFRLGKAGLASIGWTRDNLLKALLATGIIWCICQLLLLLFAPISGRSITIQAGWNNPLGQIQGLITYFLGVGLSEELWFRALLFPQIYLYLRHKLQKSAQTALLTAILCSQITFGLLHFDSYRLKGAFGGDPLKILPLCLVLSLAGIFFVLLYLRTENFFLLVAVHGLLDHPMPLFDSAIPAPAPVFLVSLFLFWSPVRRLFVSGQREYEGMPAGKG